MNDSAKRKWNARYKAVDLAIPAPAEVLSQGVRWLPLGPESECHQNTPAIRALDLACGKAGNAQFLAEHGCQVCAWDISDTVIAAVRSRRPFLLEEALVRDVCVEPPEPASFDVIVVTRFLDRALCPAISRALKPSGVLFYQTFVHGLSNPDYMLAPNELLSLFSDLHILEYHEPEMDVNGKSEAKLIAKLNR